MLLPFKASNIIFGVLGRFSHGYAANLHHTSLNSWLKSPVLIHSEGKFLTIFSFESLGLDVKAEMHHIPIFNTVFLSFHAHFTRFLHGSF